MHRNSWLILVGFALSIIACNLPLSAATTTGPVNASATQSLDPQQKPGWHLIFQDEFDLPTLSNAWNTAYPWGRINPPELEYYAPDAFNLQNGMLQIVAEHRSLEGQLFTSGVIVSKPDFQFTYGYVEIRCRVPAGKGLWPAFWLLAADPAAINEIDVFEITGDNPDTAYMTLHYPGLNGVSQAEQATFRGPDFSKDFHTFAVEWNQDKITWFIDGVERYHQSQHIPQAPMYLIANLAVGGKWPGSPSVRTPFPAYFDIDYIRVYQPN